MAWSLFAVVAPILVIYSLPLYFLGRVANRSRMRTVKVVCCLLIFAYVVWPVWDIPFDRYQFRKLCDEYAGQQVNRRVGLPGEFYVAVGTETEIVTIDRGSGLRTKTKMIAAGNELDMDRLKLHFDISERSVDETTTWGEVRKFTTTIAEGDEILGSATSFFGGAGFLREYLKYPNDTVGIECPEPVSHEENIHYTIFSKLFYKRTI